MLPCSMSCLGSLNTFGYNLKKNTLSLVIVIACKWTCVLCFQFDVSTPCLQKIWASEPCVDQAWRLPKKNLWTSLENLFSVCFLKFNIWHRIHGLGLNMATCLLTAIAILHFRQLKPLTFTPRRHFLLLSLITFPWSECFPKSRFLRETKHGNYFGEILLDKAASQNRCQWLLNCVRSSKFSSDSHVILLHW